ncbi:MAG TPA: acyl-CoA thioesterase, partial [Burkholderiaceae bacterium]|nr:acyl-CoA thioesterase [Burkholderiaceae bacterium]
RSRPAMTEALLTYRGTVYPWHCDHVGHMNVMWYVGTFDEASWQLFNAIGLSVPYLRSAQRGMAAVDQHISYLQELHAGAVVSVRTRMLEVKERSLRFEHEMIDETTGAVAARTTLKAVHLDAVQRKSTALAASVIAKAQALIPQSATA